MNQLEKAALGLAAPLSTPGTARKITLLFACLHSVNVLSGYLLRNPAGGGERYRFLFPIPIQKLRGKKLRRIVRHLATTGRKVFFLWGEMLAGKKCLADPELHVIEPVTELKSASERQILLEHKLADAETRITHGQVPLVKPYGSNMKFINKCSITILLLLTLFTTLLFPTAAKAVDPYEFQIYGYATQGKGNFSPQLLNSFVARGRPEGEGGTSPTFSSQSMMRTAIELEYGLTDKIDVAYYINFARPTGEPVQYAGSKLRFRGRFAEQGELPVDLGWYFEIEQWTPKINDDILELEFKPTLQKDIGPFSIIANFPFEKVLRGESAKTQLFEVGYLTELSYSKSKRLRYGIQFIGGPGGVRNIDPLGEQQHYVMPVVHFIAPGEVRSTVGIGFGQTRGSDHVILKANFSFGGGRGYIWD